jgi:hypothetical protein
MNDWSDTPIYAQMMAEKQEREMLEAERIENPIWVQVVEERKKKEKLMNSWQKLVIDMRNAMDLPVSEFPRTLSPEEAKLHIKMIRDEFEEEFVPAFLEQDLVEMYDAGIDVIVYVIGALSNAGFDIDPGFREIMRSNMSKFDPETGKAIKAGPNDPDGHPEGKVLKGPAYSPPNLHPIINEQFVFGPEDPTVYMTQKTPITLGIGGPKIGEGDLHMDNHGNVELQGVIFDVDVLPVIESFSIQDTYVEEEPEAEEEVVKPMPERVIPEGWPVPINIDELSPSEMFKETSQRLLYPGTLVSGTGTDVKIFDEDLLEDVAPLTEENISIVKNFDEEILATFNDSEGRPKRSNFISIDSEEQDNNR